MTPAQAKRSEWRRALRGLALIAVLAEVLWLAAANLFLGTHALPRFLGAHSEGLQLGYARAWSLFPGHVEVRGFWIRGRDHSHAEYRIDVEQAWALVDVAALVTRTFRTTWVSARGVSARVRPRIDPTEMDAQRRLVPLFPPIDGFEPVPRRVYGPEDAEPRWMRDHRWKVDLGGVHVEQVRELWVNVWHYQGQGRARGTFQLNPRRRLAVEPSTLDVESGQVTVGDDVVLDAVHGTVRIEVDGFDPHDADGREKLRYLSGELALRGVSGGLGFVSTLTGLPRIGGEGGPLKLDAKIERGVLAAGSGLSASLERVSLEQGPVRAQGRLEVAAAVHDESGERRLDATAVILPRVIAFQGQPESKASSGVVALHVESKRVDLVAPFSDARIDARVENLVAPVLNALDPLLPRAIRVREGSARLNGRFELDHDPAGGHGELHLTAENVALSIGDRLLRGTLSATVPLQHLHGTPLTLNLTGTELHIGTTAAKSGDDGDGWWLKAHVARGELKLGPQPRAELVLDARARDGKPILDALTAAGTLPGIVRSLFELPDLTIHAEARLGAQRLVLAPVSVQGGHTGLRAALRFTDEADGAFLAHAGPVDAALALERGKLKFHGLAGADKWFAGQLQALEAQRPEPPHLERRRPARQARSPSARR